MAVGDTRLFKATIAGCNATTLNPTSAGWTRISGTSDVGQSATELVVIENGIKRIVLDKTTGTSTASIRILGYDATGGVWRLLAQNETGASHDWQDLTITTVNANRPDYIEVTFTSTNRNAASSTSVLRLNRNLPYFTVRVSSIASSSASRSLALQHTEEKTVFFERPTSTPEGHDTYGFLGSNTATVVQSFWCPIPAFNMDVFVARSHDFGSELFTAAEAVIMFFSNDSAANTAAFGFTPRVYALGDANQYYGNSDGQLREAEGHRVWEGETPLIGTELLTNGQFETDLSGWTQTAGSWTRVTTQKKFGAASAEVSSASADLRRDVTGLTVGATYALTAWNRTTQGTAGATIISILGDATTEVGSAFGREWEYLTTRFVATATTHTVRLRTNSSWAGTVQFDSVGVAQVKDASGVSTLAFDTRSTTGWTTSNATVSVVDSPRGKAFRVTATASFGSVRLEFNSPQDISRFQRCGLWLRRVSGTGQADIAIRQPNNSSTGQIVGSVTPTINGDWQFFTFALTQSSAALTNFGTILFGPNVNGAVFDFGPITLSEFDNSIGARHGLVDPLEDAGLALWFPMDEASGNLADRSGNGHVGTAAGSPTYSAATVRAGLGTCIDFDGVDDTFSVADANSLDLTTALSIEQWVFTDTIAAGQARIVSKDASYYLRRNAAAIDLELTGLSDTTMSAAAALAATTWTHVVATYDGATKRIYINGALHTSEAATGSIAVTANALYIGSAGGASEFWDGKLDEPRIYSRALGPDEVAMRFNATSQRVARWVPGATTLKLEQTTDKVDGTYAMKATPSANDQTMQLDIRAPLDLSSTLYTHFGIWTKQTASDDTFIRIGSDSSNYRQWTITGSTSYAYSLKTLASPDSTTGTPDMSRVTYIVIGDMDTAGTAFFIDSLKFMNGTETGDWRYAVNTNASNGYTMKTLTTPVLNSIPRTWSINFPAAGKYYVGVSAVAAGASGTIDVGIGGVFSGTPQTVSTTSLATQTTHHIFGPFTVAAAGDANVEVKVTAVGSMTSLEVDFACIYAHEATASSPTSAIFPRDICRSALRTVTPA